jgi:O-antigen/teichoic acid export membrane protein
MTDSVRLRLRPWARSSGIVDVAWYGASKAMPAILGLGAIAFFVRHAGAAQYGYYSVVWATSLVIANFAGGWLRQSALRFAGATDEDQSRVRRAAMVASIAATAVLAVPATLVALPGVAGRCLLLVLGAWLAAAMAVQLLVVALLQAQQRARGVALCESTRAVGSLAFPVVLSVGFAANAEALVLGTALALLLAAAVGLRLLDPRPGENGSAGSTRLWWRFGWAMSVWLTIASVLQFSDRIIIQRMIGAATAGSYGAVYDATSRILVVCLFPVTMASHARIMNHWNRREYAAAKNQNRRSMLVQTVMFGPLLAGMWCLRGPLTTVLAGQDAADVRGLVLPLALGAFLWQLSLSAHKVLEVHNKTTPMLINVTVCTAANIAFNVALIPAFGPAAAAWTTAGAAAAYLGLTRLTARAVLGSAQMRWSSRHDTPTRGEPPPPDGVRALADANRRGG